VATDELVDGQTLTHEAQRMQQSAGRSVGPSPSHFRRLSGDDVQLLPGPVGGGSRTGDHRDVAREELTGRAPRQGAQDRLDVPEALDELLHPHDRDVDARERGDDARVALIGEDDERAGLGDRDVRARDAEVRRQELLPELAARDRDEPRDVGREPLVHLLREDLRHLLLREVDGGHHHVRRALPGELDDPLAEVGLPHADAARLEVRVEVDLLGRHRLRLHDPPHAARAAEAQDVVPHLRRIGGAEDRRPGARRLRLELPGELVEAPGGAVHLDKPVAQGLGSIPRTPRPRGRVRLAEAVERAGYCRRARPRGATGSSAISTSGPPSTQTMTTCADRGRRW
jgi:hypothetical protein